MSAEQSLAPAQQIAQFLARDAGHHQPFARLTDLTPHVEPCRGDAERVGADLCDIAEQFGQSGLHPAGIGCQYGWPGAELSAQQASHARQAQQAEITAEDGDVQRAAIVRQAERELQPVDMIDIRAVARTGLAQAREYAARLDQAGQRSGPQQVGDAAFAGHLVQPGGVAA